MPDCNVSTLRYYNLMGYPILAKQTDDVFEYYVPQIFCEIIHDLHWLYTCTYIYVYTTHK